MKKLLKQTFFVTALSLAFIFTSCGSDDDGIDSGLAKKVVGEYSGNYTSVATSAKPVAAKIKVTAKGSNEILIEFLENSKPMPSSFTKKLEDTKVGGIIQAADISPYVQFMTNTNTVSISSNSGEVYTFQGTKN